MSENKTDEGQQQNEAQDANKGEASQAQLSLDAGQGGILGVKAGMTQVFDQDGNALAVTVIDLRPNYVTQVKTKENDGYQAVQVGMMEKKEKAARRPEQGHAKKAGKPGFYVYQEFRLPESAKLDAYQVGQVLSAGFVKEGEMVDVTAASKGKGFQGVIKRHHFAGGMASHGASVCHRMPGGISSDRGTGKVLKGKRMAGHMGHERVTVQNLKVVRVDSENQLLLVHGAVPGPKSGIIRIRKAVKSLVGAK